MKKLLFVCALLLFATSCGTSSKTEKGPEEKEKKQTPPPANKNGYETIEM